MAETRSCTACDQAAAFGCPACARVFCTDHASSLASECFCEGRARLEVLDEAEISIAPDPGPAASRRIRVPQRRRVPNVEDLSFTPSGVTLIKPTDD
jgi:hypothetical protein